SSANYNIDGSGIIGGDLTLGDRWSIDNGTGNATVNGNATVIGYATVGGTLDVTEETTLRDNLDVFGDYSSTFGSLTLTNGNMWLGGTLTEGGNLTVWGG